MVALAGMNRETNMIAIANEKPHHKAARSLNRESSSRSSLPPQGELERSIRSVTSARWVMTMDVTLVAGPPEIHGGGGTAFDGLF